LFLAPLFEINRTGRPSRVWYLLSMSIISNPSLG
jgi:hypothetical protein